MINTIGGEQVFIGIISKGRPDNVPVMQEHLEDWGATWYAPLFEVNAYHEAGADSVTLGGNSGPATARNLMLEDAAALGVRCLMLDDDWRKAWVNSKPATLQEAISALVWLTQKADVPLVAARAGSNTFWASKAPRVSPRATVMGGMLLIVPNPLRFDENMLVSEDVDYGIQHVVEFGGIHLSNRVLVDFEHFQEGGLHGVRNAERQAKDIAYLQSKWPGIVHARPKKTGGGTDPLMVSVRFPRTREVISD